jgi:hypothetical protein
MVGFHWPSQYLSGEGRILFLRLAEREKDGGGVVAATWIERGAINWGNPPCPLWKHKEQR